MTGRDRRHMDSKPQSERQVYTAFFWLLRAGIFLVTTASLLGAALIYGVPIIRAGLHLVYVALGVFVVALCCFVFFLVKRDFKRHR